MYFLVTSSIDAINLPNFINYPIVYIILVIIRVITKRAQFPFRSWLPLAIAAPTPISALVHSSTLVTAGIYVLFRLKYREQSCSANQYLALLSIITATISGIIATFEIDFKKIIAFSTISQVSIMVLVILLGNCFLGLLHLLTHALYKALLFMCSGIIIHRHNNNQDIRYYSLNHAITPFIRSVFVVCSLSLIGFPFLRGYYSKDLILEYLYTNNNNVLLLRLLILRTFLTVAYSIRLLNHGLI